jgi:hypothetical protein
VSRDEATGCARAGRLVLRNRKGHSSEPPRTASQYDVGGKLLGCYPESPTPDFVGPYTYSDFTGSSLDAVSERGRLIVRIEDASVERWLGLAARRPGARGRAVAVELRRRGDAAGLRAQRRRRDVTIVTYDAGGAVRISEHASSQ